MRTQLKLANAAQVRSSLSRVANAVWNEEIEVSLANSVTTTCNVILSSLRVDEMQKRVEQLEKKIQSLEDENR